MRTLSSRVDGLEPSATLETDARARALRAAGVDVISFATGEPDFPTAPDIVAAAVEAARDPGTHKYSAATGMPDLRKAVADESNAFASERPIGPGNVLISNGAKQAIFSALAAVVEPGDEVLLPTPYWTTYPETIRFFGGRVVPVGASRSRVALPSVDDLDARLTSRTRLLVWCSPSNPSGAVADAEATRAVFEWARERGLWLLSDEIYRKLYYGQGRIPTLRALGANTYDRLIIVDGVSKAYSMTGWRVGWTIADERVIEMIGRLQGHLSSNVNNVAQVAATRALRGGHITSQAMLAAFARRRRAALDGLQSIRGVSVDAPDGAFYLFPNVEDVCAERGLASSEELADWLLDAARIAVVPGEAFGCPGHIRLSYALADDRLSEGLDRFREAVAM